MLFRNVALISLALVAAASAADTNPTSDHVSSLLSQRRLKEEKGGKVNSKEKDNKNKNNNVAMDPSTLQINNFEGLNVAGYGSFSLNGSVGDGTNVSGAPTGQTLIEPNRESDDGAGDEGMGGGVDAGEASSEGPSACDLGTIVDVALGDMANFSSLVAALQAANFVEILKGDGPFTVFGK